MDHSDVSNWSDRVEALLSEGKETEAEALLQTVIRAIESKGDNNLGLAAALNDLGLLYCRQGLTLKADPLLQRALAIRHRVEEMPVQK
jgi:tetratricopeptide (TPR) repeat protein